MCKTLVGKDAKFGGPDVNGQPRKFGFVTWKASGYGLSADIWNKAFAQQCGATAACRNTKYAVLDSACCHGRKWRALHLEHCRWNWNTSARGDPKPLHR